MVSGWLLKVVLGIALVGGLVIELGSPLVARSQTDDAAHGVADEVSFLVGRHDVNDKQLLGYCEQEADKRSVQLLECKFVGKDDDTIEVRVRKEARSLILKNWSVTEDWYHPEVTATAERR